MQKFEKPFVYSFLTLDIRFYPRAYTVLGQFFIGLQKNSAKVHAGTV
jgi:hypothetical protein